MHVVNSLVVPLRVVKLFFTLLFFSSKILAQSSGPNSPTSAVNIDNGGSSWSNVGNILTSDDSRATRAFTFFSDYLTATGFGFSIPPTDVIDGIVVEIEKSRTSGGLNAVFDLGVQLTKDGAAFIGNNYANGTNWPTTEAYISYGGSTDLWGATWTPAEINAATFGVGIYVIGSNTARVDHIRITVYHSAPLPITLSSFGAQVTSRNSVSLEWSTSTEINNDFFTLEKSTDGESFDFVAKVKGSGNSNTTKTYSLEDRQPYYGRSYYRLKQTDFDGNFTYSHLVKVDIEGQQQAALTVFPNPASGSQFSFRIIGIRDAGQIPLVIYDLQGRKIAEGTYTVDVAGVIEDTLEFATPLPQGVYVVKAGPTLHLTQKLVIQ